MWNDTIARMRPSLAIRRLLITTDLETTDLRVVQAVIAIPVSRAPPLPNATRLSEAVVVRLV